MSVTELDVKPRHTLQRSVSEVTYGNYLHPPGRKLVHSASYCGTTSFRRPVIKRSNAWASTNTVQRLVNIFSKRRASHGLQYSCLPLRKRSGTEQRQRSIKQKPGMKKSETPEPASSTASKRKKPTEDIFVFLGRKIGLFTRWKTKKKPIGVENPEPEMAETEVVEQEIVPDHYRPESLEALCELTKFSRKEVQFLYRGFKQECPSGIISEDTFKEIYGRFFPLGDATQYAHYVFCTLDREQQGVISFEDFMMGLSTLLKGSLSDRLQWAFSLYDINNDGYITKDEMMDITTAIYDLMGYGTTEPIVGETTARDHVNKIFQKIDLNENGFVTADEFFTYCSQHEQIVNNLLLFDNWW